MSWKAKIAGMTGRATMISVIADEVSERKSQGGEGLAVRSEERKRARERERERRAQRQTDRAQRSACLPRVR